MDLKTGLIIFAEFTVFGACVWGFTHERALLAAERRAAKRIGRIIKKAAAKHEAKRRRKIEKRALYTPVKPPAGKTKEEAA